MTKKITTGIVAHVDAGKTTLIENMLFLSHAIDKPGRVDHMDAQLDNDEQERKRKITIYAKEAAVDWKDAHINIIDTPGHVDFSMEMERSLQVMDMAVLLISGLDGVQSHTKTIWNCLAHYNIPVVVFVNKMDISVHDKEHLLQDLSANLSSSIIDMNQADLNEHIATINEDTLNSFLEKGTAETSLVQKAFSNREFFPVYFGSALKSQGVQEMLDGLQTLVTEKQYPSDFGARVFKVAFDERKTPLAHMKITGGLLKMKQELTAGCKAEEIQVYRQNRFVKVQEVQAGDICIVRGLESVRPGAGFGFEKDSSHSLLEPSLSYNLLLPDEADVLEVYGKLKFLCAADPSLQIELDPSSRHITIQLMGDIQKEVLQQRFLELTGYAIGFGKGNVVYRETIASPLFGYGHFEPLRHYAEVHLYLEPLPRNSGLEFRLQCPRELLAINWQNSILSSLQSRELRGVLTNSPLTDMRITLVAGKSHLKHTESQDFAQAALRALRQGLAKAENILLEPFYTFEIQVPAQSLSRVLYDLESKNCSISIQEQEDNMKISGKGPVACLINYQSQLASLTGGKGHIELSSGGYDKCHNAEEIIEKRGYDFLQDRHNPCGSVFCSNGSGYLVSFDEVEEHLHVPIIKERDVSSLSMNASRISQAELKAVFESAGGQNRNAKKKKEQSRKPKKDLNLEEKQEVRLSSLLEECLIVDGYNIIYDWPSLKSIAASSLFAAREELISILSNYQGMRRCSIILVFDGWKRKDNAGSSLNRGSMQVVYTKSNESADAFIERKVHQLKGKFRCVVASSDGLIQNSILAGGASRISARELERRIETANASIAPYLSKN